MIIVEPKAQNHYPDFTLMRGEDDTEKIAIDVKTTYRRHSGEKFGFSLGSYTSYIRPDNESKNIRFPYSQYKEHWVIGFVYQRTNFDPQRAFEEYSLDSLQQVPLPFEDVKFFMQEKWRITGDSAGSGNTTNIGSIKGSFEDFVAGRGIFESEEECLTYWRGYKRKAEERSRFYSNIEEFRELQSRQ